MKEIKCCKCGICEQDCEYHKPEPVSGVAKATEQTAQYVVTTSGTWNTGIYYTYPTFNCVVSSK